MDRLKIRTTGCDVSFNFRSNQSVTRRIHVQRIMKTAESFSWMINKAAISTFKTSSSHVETTKHSTQWQAARCLFATAAFLAYLGKVPFQRRSWIVVSLRGYVTAEFSLWKISPWAWVLWKHLLWKFQDWKRVQSGFFFALIFNIYYEKENVNELVFAV